MRKLIHDFYQAGLSALKKVTLDKTIINLIEILRQALALFHWRVKEQSLFFFPLSFNLFFT